MEHRNRRRVENRQVVLILNGGAEVGAGKTKNISYQGLFVRSAYRPSLHQLLEIQFLNLPATDDVLLHGHVVHRNSDGFGLEIDDTIDHDRLLNSLLRGKQQLNRDRAISA